MGLLEASGLFKPVKTVERERVLSTISSFLESDKLVLPLVGFSGVGKTSALAKFADSDYSRQGPRILLQGVDILHAQEGIQGCAENALLKLKDNSGVQVAVSIKDVTRAIKRVNDRLLVILDGLNEALMDVSELANSWIPKSLNWLRANDVQLIISSRSEYWAALASTIPGHLVYGIEERHREKKSKDKISEVTSPANGGSATQISDFTYAEAERALTAYQLKGLLSAADALHPFMLAVADEIGSEAASSASDLDRVLDLFVVRKVERALRRMPRPFRVQPILTKIAETAQIMLLRDTQWLSRTELFAAFGTYSEAVGALVDEHLWLEEEDGGRFRFQFDQVREFLQSRNLEALPLLRSLAPMSWRFGFQTHIRPLYESAWHLLRYSSNAEKIPPSVLSFSIIRLAKIERSQFTEALDLLRQATYSYPRTRSSRHSQAIAISIISRLRDAGPTTEPYLVWVGAIVENEVRKAPTDYYRTTIDQLTHAVSGLRIPAVQKLALFRRLFTAEQGVEWSSSGLRDLAWWSKLLGVPVSLSSNIQRPLALYVEHLTEIYSEDIITLLLDWLGDRTPIDSYFAEPNHVIADVAAVCLYYLRHHALALICRHLLSREGPRVLSLLEALAIAEPESVTAAAIDHLGADQPADTELAERALFLTAQHWQSPEMMVRAGAVACLSLALDRGLMHRNWAARAVFAHHFFASDFLKRGASADSWEAQLADKLEQWIPLAAAILFDKLRQYDGTLIPEDYTYLCRHDFTQAAEIIENLLVSGKNTNAALVEGMNCFLSASVLRQYPERYSDFQRVVTFLSRCFDCGNSEIRVAIAKQVEGILCNTEAEGCFSVDDVLRIGLHEFGARMVRDGDFRVRKEFTAGAFAFRGKIRERMLTEFRGGNIDGESFEKFVNDLCGNVDVYKGSFDELCSFRIADRYAQWDRAVLRYLGISEPPFASSCVEFWRGLRTTDHSRRSKEFLFLLEARSLRDAANIVGCYTEEAKRPFLKGAKF